MKKFMNNYTWSTTFSELFLRCVNAYRSGNKIFASWFSEADQDFLKSIGYTQQELFDYVDDHVRYAPNGPTAEVTLLVAAVRRDYLRTVQKGVTSTRTVLPAELPAKSAQVDGIEWLPRLIAKARAKLRGEMDPDIMYGCGGDRGFFSEWDLDPAELLRVVWAAGDDTQKIIDYVKNRAARAA
jgi:hypothetical protein